MCKNTVKICRVNQFIDNVLIYRNVNFSNSLNELKTRGRRDSNIPSVSFFLPIDINLYNMGKSGVTRS